MSIDAALAELFSRYENIFTEYNGVDVKDVNQPGLGEDSLLHLAAFHSDCSDVELLLKHGAYVNKKGVIGLTALHYAAAENKLDVVKLLVRYGADKSSKNEFGESALDWARNSNAKDVVAFLENPSDLSLELR